MRERTKRLIAATTILLFFALSGLAEGPPQSAVDFVSRGMQRFRENKIDASIADFDRAAQLDPRLGPHLWQRGISDYYAGKFQAGRQQFESHKTVNPDDVENAAWHFLCVTRLSGLETARKALMKIDLARDDRVPMAELYAFFAGRGSQETVIKAAEKAGTEQARMYAHLYLGLYAEAAGKADEARSHLRQAASARLQDNYMHDVARIHLRQRNWNR